MLPLQESTRRLALIDQALLEAGPILSVPRREDELIEAVLNYLGAWLSDIARALGEDVTSDVQRQRRFRQTVIVLIGAHVRGRRHVPSSELLGTYFERSTADDPWAVLWQAVATKYSLTFK